MIKKVHKVIFSSYVSFFLRMSEDHIIFAFLYLIYFTQNVLKFHQGEACKRVSLFFMTE